MVDLPQFVLEFLGGNVGGYLLGRGIVKLAKLVLTLVSVVAAVFTLVLMSLASPTSLIFDEELIGLNLSVSELDWSIRIM